MVRGVWLVLVLVLSFGLGAAAASFDFYRSGPNAVGLFNNLTGEVVDELVLGFSGPIEPVNAVGIGADMELVSNSEGKLHYTGSAAANGTWQVDWAWEGPRLEYAAWLANGVVVEEIPVHNPTAAFGMIGQFAGQRIRFFAPASGDPDGQPLARYLWTWSDGATAEGVRAERTFSAGEYWVILTVTDVDGNETSRLGEFLIQGCLLTVNKDGCGDVGLQPEQDTYDYGAEVVLRPTPCEGWYFVGWSGDASGATDPITIRVLGDTEVTAHFSRHEYHLWTSSNPAEGGDVPRNPDQVTYFYGENVTLTACPNENWDFVDWTGDVQASSNPVTFPITSDMTVVANFERRVYRVTFDARIGGSTEIFAANTDGSGVLQLTSDPANDWGAQWSPDGSRIAFLSNRLGYTALFVMNADGTNQHAVDPSPTVEIREFEWSNTSTIVMAGPTTRPLYVIDVDTGVPLTIDATHNWDGVHISDDASLICGSGQVIYSDGSGYRNLGGIHGADIRADALYGAYKGFDGSAGVVYFPTNERRTLMAFATDITGVYWSPDGEYVYTSSINYPYGGNPITYVFRFDGTVAYTLGLPVVRPWDMSPDNGMLAVVVRQDGVYSAGVVTLSTGELTILYNNTGDLGVKWSRTRFSPQAL